MLKNLIKKYGYSKVNSLTKYPSIPTLHKIGERGMLTSELNVQFEKDEVLFVTEKIDGVNVRILMYGDEFIIGSREELLYHNNDALYNRELNIVENFLSLNYTIPPSVHTLMVLYGELYGANIGKHGKQYGISSVGFRSFDISVPDLHDLEKSVEKIAAQRERNNSQFVDYRYFQDDIFNFLPFIRTPLLSFNSFGKPDKLNNLTIEQTYNCLTATIPTTKSFLDAGAFGTPEGIIIRNNDRSKIAKVRFEDYRRTILKTKQ